MSVFPAEVVDAKTSLDLERTWDQKLSSGLLLTFLTTHLFQFRFAGGEDPFEIACSHGVDTERRTAVEMLDFTMFLLSHHHRARTKVPRVSFTGDNFASMSLVLTKWLFGEILNSRNCDEFSV